MQITSVRTVQLRRLLDRPQRNAQGSRDDRVFTFVLVETDGGITGLGDAFVPPEQERQGAPAVGYADIEARMPFQHAAEDEGGHGE